jgi:Tfp pilus assembly protein FimT
MTLVEMGVVLAVIGVLAALGIPAMIKIVPRVKLNSSAMVLSNDIAVARMRAISKSSDFRIRFDPAGERYTTEKWSGTGWVSLGATIVNGTDLLSVSGFTPTATELILYSNGQANVTLGGQGTIILQTKVGDLGKRITIEPTGRMILERRAGTGSWVAD